MPHGAQTRNSWPLAHWKLPTYTRNEEKFFMPIFGVKVVGLQMHHHVFDLWMETALIPVMTPNTMSVNELQGNKVWIFFTDKVQNWMPHNSTWSQILQALGRSSKGDRPKKSKSSWTMWQKGSRSPIRNMLVYRASHSTNPYELLAPRRAPGNSTTIEFGIPYKFLTEIKSACEVVADQWCP